MFHTKLLTRKIKSVTVQYDRPIRNCPLMEVVSRTFKSEAKARKFYTEKFAQGRNPKIIKAS